MLRRMVLPVALVAAVAVSSSGLAVAAPLEPETAKEVALTLHAKVSPIEAVEKAEQYSKAHAFEVFARKEKMATVYEVKAVNADALLKLIVDPTSGAVLKSKQITSLKDLAKEHQNELHELAAAKTTLADAMSVAETSSGGKAIEASYKMHEGKLTYAVVVEKAGRNETVFVDAELGHAVSPMKSSSVSGEMGTKEGVAK